MGLVVRRAKLHGFVRLRAVRVLDLNRAVVRVLAFQNYLLPEPASTRTKKLRDATRLWDHGVSRLLETVAAIGLAQLINHLIVDLHMHKRHELVHQKGV